MRSVWSKHYKTFKSSNPFSSFLSAPVNQQSQPVNRPLTVGKSRTMSSGSFTITTTNTTKDNRRRSSGALTAQGDSKSKRKFDSINEAVTDEVIIYSESSSEASSSSYPSSSDSRSADDKRLKMEETGATLANIDDLLTQYSSENTSQASRKADGNSPLVSELSQTTSSYFSSVSISANSPILTSKVISQHQIKLQ